MTPFDYMFLFMVIVISIFLFRLDSDLNDIHKQMAEVNKKQIMVHDLQMRNLETERKLVVRKLALEGYSVAEIQVLLAEQGVVK